MLKKLQAAGTMAASKRLTKVALTLLKSSVSRVRFLASSPLLANSRAKLPLVGNNVFVPFNFSTVSLSRHFRSSPDDTYYITTVDRSEFTRMEWDRIVSWIYKAERIHRVVETEDFMKVLLEEKNGLAGRIFSKAGLDNTSILQAIDDFTSRKQPKVSCDASFNKVVKIGEHLNSLLENAVKHKKDMEDEFVSVEHFILAFRLDRRFGQQLFTNFGISEKDLRDAIDAVRGSLKRELNEHWGIEKELMNRIRSLKEEIDRINVEKEARTLMSLRRELEEAEKRLAEIESKWTGTHFEEALLNRPIAESYGYKRDGQVLFSPTGTHSVVGQKMAVMSVADAIRRSRAGLSDPNRPIASFKFMGPWGVGKKTLVNTLADYLFQTEETSDFHLYNTIVRIDMREYMGKDAVSRLVVSLGKGGVVQLTEFVRHRPYCLILFEGIEKAHPDVLSILLQILDTGRITDCEGKTVCFKNTVIIMTSKIGSHLVPDTLSSNTYDTTKKQVLDLARETFRPEFMNCIDEWIVFKPYDASEIRNLAEKWMRFWKEEYEKDDVELRYTSEAIDVVGRLLYDANSVEMVVKKQFLKEWEKFWGEVVWDKQPSWATHPAKVDVNSDLCFGLLRGKRLPTHYQIYLGTAI